MRFGSLRGSRRLPLAATLLALVVAGAAVAADPSRVAPEFAYEDINPVSASHGQRLSLAQLYAERGVVLNFLASWCDYCWKEIPDLERLRQSKAAPIVGVAADEHGDLQSLLALLAKTGSTMPVLLVPRAEIDAMSRAYDHRVLPATYLIDREGRIRGLFQGLAPLAELARKIDTELVPIEKQPAPDAGVSAPSP